MGAKLVIIPSRVCGDCCAKTEDRFVSAHNNNAGINNCDALGTRSDMADSPKENRMLHGAWPFAFDVYRKLNALDFKIRGDQSVMRNKYFRIGVAESDAEGRLAAEWISFLSFPPHAPEATVVDLPNARQRGFWA